MKIASSLRYIKATVLCGVISAVSVAAVYELGLFRTLESELWRFLGANSQLVQGRSLAQYLVFVALAFASAWATIDISKTSLKFIVIVAALLELMGLTWVLNLYGIFFSPFPSALAILISFTAALLYGRSDAGRRKRTLRAVLGDRISTRDFYALIDSPAPLNFSGEMREVTVAVCELFNHEDLMDALPVQDYVAATNLFLRHAAEFMVEQGGYLDECDGESLRVVFGAPLADERHSAKACHASLELVQRLENLNRECDEKWHKTLDFRVGINSGEIIAAAYGSQRLSNFSVAGEPVEFARRLCAANLLYGSKILIGSRTFELAANELEVRPMELLRGRGERMLDEVYELLAMKDGLAPDERARRDSFWKGVVCCREERWDDAREHFRAAAAGNGPDAPLEFYMQCVEHRNIGREAGNWPPPKL